MVKSIHWKFVSLCGSINNFMLTVSITHPKKTWHVDQVQSPTSRLFRDMTTFLYDVLVVSSGHNTLYSAWNKVQQMWCHLWAVP